MNDGFVNSQPASVKVNVLNVIKVGITEPKLQVFKFIPNPTTGIINLEYSNETESVVEISVCNMMGIEVFRRKTSKQERFQVDISNLVNGLYMMKIKTDSQEYVNKIILQKE